MDLNLHPSNSNPRWRKMWNWRPQIRIPKVWIRISHEEQVKRLKLDSNHLQSDSNPWVWNYKEQLRAIRIFELRIWIPSPKIRLKDEGQTEGFESLSYGFESLLGTIFKFYKGDSNQYVIRIPYTAIRNPLSTKALNVWPTTLTTRFSNAISLTMAS